MLFLVSVPMREIVSANNRMLEQQKADKGSSC